MKNEPSNSMIQAGTTYEIMVNKAVPQEAGPHCSYDNTSGCDNVIHVLLFT